jgi:anthranilate phosphoribosyltransferase
MNLRPASQPSRRTTMYLPLILARSEGALAVVETFSFSDILLALTARRELSAGQMRSAMLQLMAETCPPTEAAAFLMALRSKGETSREIAVAARVLREHMMRWEPGVSGVLDTCGTGGDGSGTFNISTATALVVAAAGVPVVKHGNRSVSSRTGSADVLAALGVRIDGDVAHARLCLRQAGFAFCFAPQFHPALRYIAPVRRHLGVPTIFNCLGPLANPAGAARQLLGVGRPELLDRIAGALAELGTAHAVIVCSQEGLDEVSLSAPTHVRRVRGREIAHEEWSAADLGLAPCRLEELAVESAEQSGRIIERVLAGEEGPAARVVLANAAAGLLAAERVPDLRQGVELARDAIASGRALGVLETLRSLREREAPFAS